MEESRYITQYIVTGIGKLNHLRVIDLKNDHAVLDMSRKALSYLDDRIREDYDKIKEDFPGKLQDDHLGYIHIQYLYARSFFIGLVDLSPADKEAFEYFRSQASQYWTEPE